MVENLGEPLAEALAGDEICWEPSPQGGVAYAQLCDFSAESLSTILSSPDLERLPALAIQIQDPFEFEIAVGVLSKVRPVGLGALTLCTYDAVETFYETHGNLSQIGDALVGLERLELQANSLRLGALKLPKLKYLQVRVAAMTADTLRSIAEAPWPELETLTLWFGSKENGAEYGPGDVEDLLTSLQAPRLRNLRLMNTDCTNEVTEVLGRVPLPNTLSRIDLSFGLLNDEGLTNLLSGPVGGLELVLDANVLTHSVVANLDARISAADQREPEGNWQRATGIKHYVPIYCGDDFIYLNLIDESVEDVDDAPLELA